MYVYIDIILYSTFDFNIYIPRLAWSQAWWLMLAVGWGRASVPPTWTRWVPCEHLGLHDSLVAGF